MFRFQITEEPILAASLAHDLEDVETGGVVTFEGRVRDHNEGKEVLLLEYEAFPELAEKEGLRILEEAAHRWGVARILARHRVGRLEIGETAVWVGVAAGHRAEAFAACRYVIDELKTRVPIWKKEHYQDGVTDWIQSGG